VIDTTGGQDSEELRNKTRIIPFVFKGQTGEYFRIWIVNIVLTILTVGIYSAWAKVRTHRYFYGSTSLAGRSFDYTADPLAILKGRIIATVAFIIWYFATTFFPLTSVVLVPLLLLALPWVIVRSLKFRAFHTRYRNLRFHFYGSKWEAASAYLLFPLLTIFTLGLLWPYVAYLRAKFKMDNLGFGDRRSSFFGKVGGYYSIWLTLFLYFVALIVVLFVFMMGSAFFGSDGSLVAEDVTHQLPPLQLIGAGLLYLVVIFAVYVFPPAYIKAMEGNYLLNNSEIAGYLPHSTMKVGELFYIYATNIVGIVLSLGLAIPWAMIRAARYRLEHTALEVGDNLDSISAGDRYGIDATGEELGEVFDIDLGF